MVECVSKDGLDVHPVVKLERIRLVAIKENYGRNGSHEISIVYGFFKSKQIIIFLLFIILSFFDEILVILYIPLMNLFIH